MKGHHGKKIDLLNLYINCSTEQWNKFLLSCQRRNDLKTLEDTLYGIELGMNDLTKQKLNTEKMCEWFLRLQRSIERTMRDVIRARVPNPLDDPLNKNKFMHAHGAKKKRDLEFEYHLRKIRF